MATQILTNCSFHPNKPGIHLLPKTTRLSVVRASSKPPTTKSAFVSQEDLKYLVQLGGGSVAGAAAIKYGSIIFPEITQPNLTLALFMISAPLILAVLLLFNQSRLP